MKLIKINDYAYLNMDFIVEVFIIPNSTGIGIYKALSISGDTHTISKEAYNNILAYGKAKI